MHIEFNSSLGKDEYYWLVGGQCRMFICSECREQKQHIIKYRKPEAQVGMEPENPILKQLTTSILPSSVLTLVDILPNQICVEIKSHIPHHDQLPQDKSTPAHKPRSKSKVTSKQYRIKFENNRQFQQVYALVHSHSTRKLKLNQKNGGLFAHKFKDISFSQILVEKQSQAIFDIGLQKMNAEAFRILPVLKIEEICQIFTSLHQAKKKTKNRTFQVEFHTLIDMDNIMDMVKIISNWINLCECESQLEKLSLYHQSVLVLSLSKNKQYGLSICLHRHSTNAKLCLAILELFIKYPIFVSVEFLDWEPSNHDAVNFVFVNYHHRAKYLIKFGNYLEITELRFFINTTGMNRAQVTGIFDILKQPGHYQLVCHSSKQFFQEVVAIFLYKPLIYFKYFVPLTESQELQCAVEAMMQKAQLLRKKVQVFMNMLKCPEKMDLSMVIKLFLTMSKTSAQ